MARSKIKRSKLSKHDRTKLFLELLVVFLGVTAGFILNNWRIQRAERELETKYIEGFLRDVKLNITDLESFLESDSLWMDRSSPIMESARVDSMSNDSAMVAMGMIVNIFRYEENTGTYEDIINSGNLNILSSFEQKSAVVDYHLSISGVGFLDEYFSKYFSDYVMPFLINEIDVLAGEAIDPEIFQSYKFRNVFAGYFSMVTQRITAYNNLLEESYALRDLLEE